VGRGHQVQTRCGCGASGPTSAGAAGPGRRSSAGGACRCAPREYPSRRGSPLAAPQYAPGCVRPFRAGGMHLHRRCEKGRRFERCGGLEAHPDAWGRFLPASHGVLNVGILRSAKRAAPTSARPWSSRLPRRHRNASAWPALAAASVPALARRNTNGAMHTPVGITVAVFRRVAVPPLGVMSGLLDVVTFRHLI
jgi:hypothetical protein